MHVLGNISAITPPASLYHYTMQAGLLGILKSDSIWASKVHYLNDSSEYQLGLDLARVVLRERLESERDSSQRAKIECLIDNIHTIEGLNVCVCSFSEERDLLSQWRAYGGPGGCSVGFRTSYLPERAAAQNFILAACEYDEERQRALASELINEALSQDFNTVPGYISPDRPRTYVVLPTGGDFAQRLATFAPIIKHKTFHEEKEWRLIAKMGLDVTRLSFRPGKSMLTPYYELQLCDQKERYLDSITVAPCPQMGLAIAATTDLVRHWHAGQWIVVSGSEIPYRDW